ncbi:MAG: transcriptional repressor [Anaerolineales bacterium]|nr:transcriptional repressor [Anaerolineales bacterium]
MTKNLIKILRERGYRLTPQREMILAAIIQAGDHVSAEDVFTKVQEQSSAINIATVYRTLDMLVEEGLACRTDLGIGEYMYATNQHGPHIHLICRKCGYTQDADHSLLKKLEETILSEYDFVADLHHIAIFGLCAGHQLEDEGGQE